MWKPPVVGSGAGPPASPTRRSPGRLGERPRPRPQPDADPNPMPDRSHLAGHTTPKHDRPHVRAVPGCPTGPQITARNITSALRRPSSAPARPHPTPAPTPALPDAGPTPTRPSTGPGPTPAPATPARPHPTPAPAPTRRQRPRVPTPRRRRLPGARSAALRNGEPPCPLAQCGSRAGYAPSRRRGRARSGPRPSSAAAPPRRGSARGG